MVTVLRIERVKTGMTLRKFANSVGISETTLSRIETGKSYITPKQRVKLSEYLGMDVGDICDENGWPVLYRRQIK